MNIKVGTIVYGQHRIPEGEKGLGEPYTKAGTDKRMGLSSARRCIECAQVFNPSRMDSRICSSKCKNTRNHRKTEAYCKGGCGRVQNFSNKRRDPKAEGYCINCIPRRPQHWVGIHYRNGNWSGVSQAIADLAIRIEDSECWHWTTETKYPSHAIYRGTEKIHKTVHRLSLEAKLGRDLITGEQAHHICANPRCVNPDHLQLASAAENVGEMMGRRTFEARIKFLEEENAQLKSELEELRRRHA